MTEQAESIMMTNLEACIGRYLSFTLSNETYGINILQVREIIGIQPITRVPGAKSWVKGVINLRGKVVPVMDLRLRLRMDEASFTEETCIIIVDLHDSLTGFIVDAVSEVVDFSREALEPPPSFQSDSEAMVAAMGKLQNKVVMLLDMDIILQKQMDNAL